MGAQSRQHRLLAFASASLAALAMAGAASAQGAADRAPAQPANVPQATEAAGQLETVVVTAERREQRLQDVPISATVISANEIQRRGVQTVADLQQVAPSVAINTVNRSTFINIRGVGISQSAPTSNPGVAYYLDGQLIPHEQFIGQSFFDIASIEVLRGPQGTLTGQNSTGGAVYVRTPDPRFDASSGYLTQTVGNYATFRSEGAVNVAMNDEVALRVAAVHDHRDSYSNNIGPSVSKPGRMNLDAIRGNFAYRSQDGRLRANLRGELFDYRTDNIAVKNRNDKVTSDPFTIEEDALSYLVQRGYRASGELRYDTGAGVEVRGLTSWQNGFTHDQTDGDRTATALPVPANLATSGANTAVNPGRVSRATTDFRTFINEVNLVSTSKGPLQWVAGAFFLNEIIPVTLLRDNRNTTNFLQSNSTIQTKARNTTKSVFGQANWYLTPMLELVAGGRYSWDKQVYDRYLVASAVTPTAQIRAIQDSGEFTGKAAVNLHLTGGTLVYASASKGYKQGGVNLTPNTPNFLPERNFVYEAGVKTELLDRHLRVNGDVFYSDYKDIQLNSLFNGLPQTQNAASGKAWGGELELTGQFQALAFNLGAGYLNATFAKGVCLNNSNNGAGTRALCPSTSATTADEFVPEGRQLPLSPRWTINAGVQYAIEVAPTATLTPRLQWAHLDHQLATPFPSAATVVPHHDVFDARLTLDLGDRYRIEGYVDNLTDKVYVASQIQSSSSADGGYIYGAPRTFGVRATVKFGG